MLALIVSNADAYNEGLWRFRATITGGQSELYSKDYKSLTWNHFIPSSDPFLEHFSLEAAKNCLT